MTGLWVLTAVLAVCLVLLVWAVQSAYGHRGFTAIVLCVGLVAGAALTVRQWATTYRNDQWVVCYVTDKDRGADNGSYRVYTRDCGQLANQDSWLRWKQNSADLWQQIPREGKVRLRIAGMRWRPASQFPNIFDVEPAP